jgi:AcrR family transcriptional regulator
MARQYRQARRGESAEETRRRIVQATFDLHGQQGIAATTMKQIAERAGVSVGSVYHHFPTYDDAINACGAHAFEDHPIPTAAIFEGAGSRGERVRRLARALFHMFAGVRAFQSVIADQDKLPVLRPFVAQEQAARGDLAAEALGADGPAAETLAALLDSGAYDAFRRQGFGPDAAAERAAEVANAWLDTLYSKEAP